MNIADRRVCINLKERDDRWKHAKDQFASAGLDVDFHRVDRHPKGGRYGCYDSHRSVIQKAYDDGLNTILVFEDDVLFNEGYEEVFKDAKTFLESDTEFEALYLGSHIMYVDEKTFPTIWRVKCVYAHAYILSRQGMKKFIDRSDLFEKENQLWPQDVTLNSVCQQIYAHSNSDAISQDPQFGTDLIWLQNVPDRYSHWFQNVVFAKYQNMLQPLIRSNWWSKTWLGQRFMFGMGPCVVNDGRISLKSILAIERLAILVLILFIRPPNGYFTFFKDMYQHLKKRRAQNKKKE